MANLKITPRTMGGTDQSVIPLESLVGTGEVRLKIFRPGQIEDAMQTIDDYIGNLRHLPPAPKGCAGTHARLLNQPDVDSSKVVKLISYDPALTANVMRICNSAYYGASTPTSDLQEAVTQLQDSSKFISWSPPPGRSSGCSAPLASFGYGLEQGGLWKHSVCLYRGRGN